MSPRAQSLADQGGDPRPALLERLPVCLKRHLSRGRGPACRDHPIIMALCLKIRVAGQGRPRRWYCDSRRM